MQRELAWRQIRGADMNLQQSPTSTVERPGARNGSETRLQGRWLLIARVGWMVLALCRRTLKLVMIARYDVVLQAHRQPGPQCFALQLTAFDRQFLHQFGLSLGFLAAYHVMLDAVSVLVCCALGALIFWRKSADRMALFCAFMLVLFGGAGFTSILQDALAPVSPAWFALIGTLDVLGQSSFMIFVLLFPSGRFVPRWTRWVALCVVLYWISTIFFGNGLTNTNGSFWSNLVFVALLLCSVGAQVYRYRRVSPSRERPQTKWVVFVFSIGILGFVLFIGLVNVLLPPAVLQSIVLGTLVAGTIIYSFLILIPLSIAIPILRSRLSDTHTFINKALVYGLLTTLLAAVYAGLIIGLESLAGVLTPQGLHQPVAPVVYTLRILALFHPLPRRIPNIIDPPFFRLTHDAP